MSSNKNLEESLDITSYSPLAYGLSYLANVLVFSLIYAFFFENDFKGVSINFVQSLYFSVVTVTTLGFGDLTPKLDAVPLLIAVTAQVIIGVITIGLFLNAISHKLSKRKDFAQKEYEEEVKNKSLAKLLTILRPAIVSYLEVLAETYRVTTTRIEGDFIKVIPKEAFSQDYYDQISRQDFLSNETRYGKGVMTWADFIEEENERFSEQINDYLNKFAASLPVDLVELLVSLKDHRFLYHSRQAKQISQFREMHGFNTPWINCSGQLIPDSDLSFSSAFAGDNPALYWCGRCQL